MARVITITSPKGGVGKTTTAANLAAGLAQRGQRVLLVEADPQGALVPSVGCADQPRPAGLVQVLAGEVEARDAVVSTGVDDVDLLAATAADGRGAMELEISAQAHPLHLREVLDRLAPQYDHVIVDSAPGVGPLARLALCAADGFVVPVQAEELSLRTLDQLFALVEEIRRDWQPELECDGLLLTMVDLRTRMSVRVVNQLHEHYGDKVLMAMVPRAVGLQEMPLKGAPSLVFAPNSRGAQAYSEVAEELLINLAGRVAAEDMDEEQANQLLAEAVAGGAAAWPGPGASMH